MQPIVLITDPRVLSVPIKECGEPLIDLRDQKTLAFGPSPEVPNNLCYTKLRKSLYEKLCEAQKLLPNRVRLCVYEGWRSLELQEFLFKKMYKNNQNSFAHMNEKELFFETTKLVSPIRAFDGTANIPPHSTGGAVDVYLIGSDEKLLDMGMPLDQWSHDEGARLSQTDSEWISDEARNNRLIMKSALSAVGCINYPTEYWHWSYGDRYWAYMTQAPQAIFGALQ